MCVNQIIFSIKKIAEKSEYFRIEACGNNEDVLQKCHEEEENLKLEELYLASNKELIYELKLYLQNYFSEQEDYSQKIDSTQTSLSDINRSQKYSLMVLYR
jgi:hypothetical protein